MDTHPGEGDVKEEKFPNTRKAFQRWVCGEFWNLRGQHNWEDKKKKNNNTQNMRLMATSSRDVAQMLTRVTSKQGLNREAPVACLG